MAWLGMAMYHRVCGYDYLPCPVLFIFVCAYIHSINGDSDSRKKNQPRIILLVFAFNSLVFSPPPLQPIQLIRKSFVFSSLSTLLRFPLVPSHLHSFARRSSLSICFQLLHSSSCRWFIDDGNTRRHRW